MCFAFKSQKNLLDMGRQQYLDGSSIFSEHHRGKNIKQKKLEHYGFSVRERGCLEKPTKRRLAIRMFSRH